MFAWDLWREAKQENVAVRRALAAAVDAAAAMVARECGQRLEVGISLLDVTDGGLSHPCSAWCNSGSRIPMPDVSQHWDASLSAVRRDTESLRRLASAEAILVMWRESQLAG